MNWSSHSLLVSGGAGAVGTAVGVAVLESGADVVFVDVSDPTPESWGTQCIQTSKFDLLYNCDQIGFRKLREVITPMRYSNASTSRMNPASHQPSTPSVLSFVIRSGGSSPAPPSPAKAMLVRTPSTRFVQSSTLISPAPSSSPVQ